MHPGDLDRYVFPPLPNPAVQVNWYHDSASWLTACLSLGATRVTPHQRFLQTVRGVQTRVTWSFGKDDPTRLAANTWLRRSSASSWMNRVDPLSWAKLFPLDAKNPSFPVLGCTQVSKIFPRLGESCIISVDGPPCYTRGPPCVAKSAVGLPMSQGLNTKRNRPNCRYHGI